MEKPDDKGFLSRWSARKADARAKEADAPVAAEPAADDAVPEIDAAELPSIEDLTEESDYTVFLRKGVPDAMRKAALRKLWVTEPSVVNYRPLVEYAWHNNEPGFGPLLPTDNVEEMLKRIFGGSPEPAKEPEEVGSQAAEPDAAEPVARPASQVATDMLVQTSPAIQEPAPVEPEAGMPPRRRHGGALPS